MVLLKRLETYALQNNFSLIFSLDFKRELVGCTEASFITLESITCLKGLAKYLVAFLVYAKHLTLFGLMVGLPFKIFSGFGVKGKMLLAIKNFYTFFSARVLYDGSLSRTFPVIQDTGKGRILALFMYKMYIIGLLTELNNQSFAITINGVTASCSSFTDDISLLQLYPSSLQSKFYGQLL